MKIGILSMQKILNYGSFLQALSLKLQMEARGHDVYFVDILPGHQIVPLAAPTAGAGLLKKLDRYFIKRLENFLLYKKMTKLHIQDQERYLQTGKMLRQGEKFDLVIIGSDEVFNAVTPSKWGFSAQLFGKVESTNRVVTYAASCGSTTYQMAEACGIIPEIADAMKNLQAISVRDINTVDFVKSITGHEPELHVDPVFISDFDKYIPRISIKKSYLLVYSYSNRINDESEIAAICAYAERHALEILCVGMQQRWCKHNIAANGFELLAYVKNAACVVTDTFHGTVFSIKYGKQFATLIRDSNRNKLGGLLEQFELMDRSVEDVKKLGDILDASIDRQRINEKLWLEQKKAFCYLDRITERE